MRTAVFPSAKPQENQPHVVFPGLLQDQVNNRGVEFALFRLELFPIDRDFQRVGVEIVNGRPDFGEQARPRARIVALRAKDEEGRAFHDQGVMPGFIHDMGKRIVAGLPRRSAHQRQENDKRDGSERTE